MTINVRSKMNALCVLCRANASRDACSSVRSEVFGLQYSWWNPAGSGASATLSKTCKYVAGMMSSSGFFGVNRCLDSPRSRFQYEMQHPTSLVIQSRHQGLTRCIVRRVHYDSLPVTMSAAIDPVWYGRSTACLCLIGRMWMHCASNDDCFRLQSVCIIS